MHEKNFDFKNLKLQGKNCYPSQFIIILYSSLFAAYEFYYYSCGLSTETKECSSPSVCLLSVYVCACGCPQDNSKNNGSIN